MAIFPPIQIYKMAALLQIISFFFFEVLQIIPNSTFIYPPYLVSLVTQCHYLSDGDPLTCTRVTDRQLVAHASVTPLATFDSTSEESIPT
jgi:hypothetical protein